MDTIATIAENVRRLRAELPAGVTLVAAAKGQPAEAVVAAVAAGVTVIGENYLQDAQAHYRAIGRRVAWHFIGRLQRNKVKGAIALFDVIETVDSLPLAAEIVRRSHAAGRLTPVLVEVNSGREGQKAGVLPGDVEALVREIARLPHITVAGLMTMGPQRADPAELRPYFAETKRLFDHLKSLAIPGVALEYLSMGMTDSYRVAVAEGANIVRIGTGIFGARPGK